MSPPNASRRSAQVAHAAESEAAPAATAAPKRAKRGRTVVRLPEGTPSAVVPPGAVDEASRVRRRGDDVRERVLRAALECFSAFGFEGTSTRAVAARAKVTHTLVLYHFQSKERLWYATMEDAVGRYTHEMESRLAGQPDKSAKASLATFIDQFVRMSARYPQVHRILTMESNQDTPRLQWVIDRFLRKHFTVVRDLIRRGQAEGTIREGDPARLYYLIIGAGGTLFATSTEYRELTGRDVFSEVEILRNIALMYEMIFI